MAEARWPAPLMVQAAPAELDDRMRCALSRLDLTAEAAARQGTDSGGVAMLQLIANRARREYTAGLFADTDVTLGRLGHETDRLRTELGLPTDGGCG